MLHKIIYKNFKSNIRKYILFFVSNIIAVAELFIFWGLNDVVVRAVTEPSIMMGIKSDFMIAVGLITVVTILLMVFSMRYYIKLRAKDYGTFIMLGMKKKMSYMLLFAEYIIGCIGSLLIGILLGNLLLYGILYCLNQYNPQIITLQKVDPVVYKNTILLCLGVMLGIFIILLVWMDGRNLSSLMMKEEIKEKRPVSSKWLLFTVLGIVFIILAIKQYKPGTWGYYFAHIYFLIGGIYKSYYLDVYHFLCGLSSNKEIAEDITQETFTKALTAINSYDGRKDIRAWLFTIARNTYFTYCKREKIYVEWEPPTEQVDIQTEFIDNLINKEQVEKIHNFLKNMKDPYKIVFELRIHGELSFEKIGRIFGKSSGWARVTYYRAKMKILEYMEAENNE